MAAHQNPQPPAQPTQPRPLNQAPPLGAAPAAATILQGKVVGSALPGPAATGLIRVARV